MAGMLKITLKRSLIGQVPQNRKTAKALGLRRPNRFVIVKDCPQIRGMAKAIQHMVTVEEVNE